MIEPRVEGVIEDPLLLADLHGKVIYTTCSVYEEDKLFTLTYKNLYLLDLDTKPHSNKLLAEIYTVNTITTTRFSRIMNIEDPVASLEKRKLLYSSKTVYIFSI